jgi:hypothetical protein
MPSHFWDDAFSIACYLINRMPTPTFANHSPFDTLFNCKPDYTFLWVFECVCRPNLHPYNSNKFQPRSTQCLFLGYNPCHNVYKCLHLQIGRLYISRDVVFNDSIFACTYGPSTHIFSPSTTSQPISLSIIFNAST